MGRSRGVQRVPWNPPFSLTSLNKLLKMLLKFRKNYKISVLSHNKIYTRHFFVMELPYARYIWRTLNLVILIRAEVGKKKGALSLANRR